MMRIEPVLAAAGLIGLDEALASDAAWTVASLAQRLGLVAHRLRWVLALFAANGFVARDGERFVARVPIPRPHGRVAGAPLLAARLRDPAPLAWSDVVGSVDAAALAIDLPPAATHAPAIFAQVVPALGAGSVLLDAGCGSGDLAWHALAVHPALRVVLCDVPAVLAMQRRTHVRAVKLPGDLRVVELPACDAAVLGHVLHTTHPADGARIVARVAAALRPEGRLAIVELATGDADDGAVAALQGALALSLFDLEVPQPSTLERWCDAAGLVGLERTAITDAAVVVTGTRP